MILYIENPKDSIRKLLELISEFSKVADTKLIHRNHLHFYILTMKNQKAQLRNQSLRVRGISKLPFYSYKNIYILVKIRADFHCGQFQLMCQHMSSRQCVERTPR